MDDNTTAEPQTLEGKIDEDKITDVSELQKKVSELLDENASRRVTNKHKEQELEELRQFKQAQDQKQQELLAEQGKFKELFEEQSKKLEELSKLPETLTQYEEVFKKQLDEEVKVLPETVQKMIFESSDNIAKKLEQARALRAELGKSTNSPGAVRPGGDIHTQDVEQLIGKYKTEKDMGKRLEMFNEIKTNFPDVLKKLT